MGLLAASRPATKGIRESLMRSRWPMGFIFCSRLGLVQQILWNGCATDEGLDGLGVTMRYAPGSGQDQQLVLTWNGEQVPFIETPDVSG